MLASKKWKLVEKALENSTRVLLYGPPGTGKTYAAMRWGLKGAKAYGITVTPFMSKAAIEGYFAIKGNNFEFIEGVFPRAWRSGGRLVINEIHRASEDVLVLMHSVCDDPEFAEHLLPDGRVIKPKPNFQVVATMNGTPDEMDDALLDRFPVRINIEDVNPAAIENNEILGRDPALVRMVGANQKKKPVEARIPLRKWIELARLKEKGMRIEDISYILFGDNSSNVGAKEFLGTMKLA